jgi:hypothetical protein
MVIVLGECPSALLRFVNPTENSYGSRLVAMNLRLVIENYVKVCYCAKRHIYVQS